MNVFGFFLVILFYIIKPLLICDFSVPTRWCTTQVNFTTHSMDKQWLITSTSISTRGLEFISTMEHKRYPFIGVQFHPEKQYEWNPQQRNPHSKISIKANRYFYDLIVDLAKLNNNRFSREKDERKALIYNYFPRPHDKIYDQIYVFKWELWTINFWSFILSLLSKVSFKCSS